MEHESFENPAIAAVMNEHFINIKVDREERPDLDQIYMSAVHGADRPRRLADVGLPHAELEPFYGGTYWPPDVADGHARLSRRARAGARGLGGAPGPMSSAAPRADRRRRRR